MLEEQKAFITKLIERLGNEDWTTWLNEEKKSMDSLKASSNNVFYDNLLSKINHEINKLKEE